MCSSDLLYRLRESFLLNHFQKILCRIVISSQRQLGVVSGQETCFAEKVSVCISQDRLVDVDVVVDKNTQYFSLPQVLISADQC